MAKIKLFVIFTLITTFLIFASKTNAQNNNDPYWSYSLSFSSDNLSAFHPTAPNHFQNVNGFLWRDGDKTSLKNMENLTTNWKLPDAVSVVRADSYYYEKCPDVRKDLPCIVFSAQFTTNASGRYPLTLEVFQNEELLVWNTANFEIVSISTPTPTIVPTGYTPTTKPTFTSPPTPFYSSLPLPNRELEEVQQKVRYLEEKVEQQQTILQKILFFLKKIFGFKN